MSLPNPPPIGHPVPPTTHAVSVHIPTWQDMCDLPLGAGRIKAFQRIGYPRSFLHPSIQQLSQVCKEQVDVLDRRCLIFPSRSSAAACTKAMTHLHGEKPRDIRVHVMSLASTRTSHCISVYAVFFPSDQLKEAMAFWRLTGLGISSRLAAFCLDSSNIISSMSSESLMPDRSLSVSPAHLAIQDRIAALLGNPRGKSTQHKALTSKDVYLYPSGMAAIYHLHRLLLRWRGTRSVMFGFPYELTLKILETYGPGSKFFAFATSEELDDLEVYLEREQQAGRSVQAIWSECPSNPLLRTPDFERLRRLANRYQTVLVVDETIGGFANVDLLDVADILVTSLTKGFSGYSDVMGGSVVLNPSSSLHATLQSFFQSSYQNELYVADAVQLERNSRDFHARTAKVNKTTLALVDFFGQCVDDPSCPIGAVYHPSSCWSIQNYHRQMRPRTEHFEPGYGGVFTLEFTSIAAARTFFDATPLHKGPSLGASVTLLQPYVQTVFYKEKAWAAQHGLRETIIRVSVGLEDYEPLLAAFQGALNTMLNTLKQEETRPQSQPITLVENLEALPGLTHPVLINAVRQTIQT